MEVLELPLKYTQNPGVRQMCLFSVRRKRVAASVSVFMFAEDQSTEKGGDSYRSNRLSAVFTLSLMFQLESYSRSSVLGSF